MNIAIVGATGNVGRKILEVLENKNFSLDNLYCVASSKSAGSKITFKDKDGNSKTIEVENGLSVMEGAIQNDIPGIDADCGGSMACATCHVYVEEKWFNKIPKAEEAEVDMIDMAFEPKKNSRLSCQLIVSDELNGLTVTTPDKQS